MCDRPYSKQFGLLHGTGLKIHTFLRNKFTKLCTRALENKHYKTCVFNRY